MASTVSVIERLRQALDEVYADTTPVVLVGAALLQFAGAVFDAATLPAPMRGVVVGFDLGVVGACLAFLAARRRGWVRGRALDVAWVALGTAIAADMLVTMSLTRQPAYGSFLILVLVGGGVVLRSFTAFGVFASLVALGWGVVGWGTGVVAEPIPYAFGLIAGFALGGVLCVARLRAHSRIAILRLRDRVRGERLRHALAAARRTLEERDRVDAEKEMLRAALLHAQQLEAVGRLSAAVAHDINNVLAAILSASEMLLADAQLDAAGRDDLATIMTSARRGADFTRSLLAVGRRGKYASERLDPTDLVRSALQDLEQTFPVETKIEVQLGHGDARIEGDPDQLTQAIINLCTHASKAMPDGGTVWLQTALVTLDGADAHRRAVAPGAYVVLAVADSGEGMDSIDRQRAFEPFYSKDADTPSGGLALAMAYGAARNHGGIAEIESAPGRGTVVTLHLPCADADARGPVAQSSAPEGSLRTDLRDKTVLLVDDEPSVRAVARRILERMGVRVREAENGRRALVAHAAEGPFDVTVVDLSMPVMGGRELFGRLRTVAPDARVIVVTGADGRDDAMDLVAAGAVGVIEKPYTPGGLTRAVRAALRLPTPPAPAKKSA
jgi:signal transduction histidine kinase/ActR/RegA family two-component response regulator